tara:strand:- start:1810 stop:2907 length:1098 start_codon:yes stop_codon:yes gene_type:complete
MDEYQKEIRDKILLKGREIRHNKLKQFKLNIPSVNNILNGDSLNLEIWFNSYLNLINFGARKFISIDKKDNKLILKYYNYSNSKRKLFVNYLPRKIKIDENFIYFFGLWCGDRVGRGRFGVVNKNKDINFYTKSYLERLYQKVEFVLIYSHKIKKPKLNYNIDKIVCNKKSKYKGYVISVHSNNSIMFSFFDYLYVHLDLFLDLIYPKINFFLAGLFDAEGNVSLEDNCFRWSCKDMKKVEIFKDIFIKLGIFRRYDGANLVSYNRQYFKSMIFPYMKHSDKINRCNLLFNREGVLEERFLNILNVLKCNPNITFNNLSKTLKRVKVYSQIKFLENLRCVKTYGYPKMIKITNQGLNQLYRGQGQ